MTAPPRHGGDRRGEPERDAWLSEALRHAPDANARPPNALSDAILRKARAATAMAAGIDAAADEPQSSPPPPSPPRKAIPARRTGATTIADTLAAAWTWLARPPVAAGFASVMAATLVGLMWWDQPMDQAVPRRPAPSQSAPASPSPAAAPSDQPGPQGAGTPVEQERRSSTAPVAEAKADRLSRDEASAELRKSIAKSAPPPQRADKSTQDEKAERSAAKRQEPQAFKDRRAEADSTREAPTQAVPAVPPPPPSASADIAAVVPAPAPAPAPAIALGARPAAAPAPELRLREQARSSSAGNLTSSARAPALQGAAPAVGAAPGDAAISAGASADGSSTRLLAKAAATGPMTELMTSLSQQPQRWSWQRGAGAQAMNSSLQTWLLQLDSETASRWAAAPPVAAPATSVVRLYLDEALYATLRIDDDGVQIALATTPTRVSKAFLPQATIAVLRRGLDLAAP